MALAAGTRLGAYRIEAAIGSGATGDVYKATDTRLNRTVAIKMLRDGQTGRIQREAQAIAALNHPHICTLYDAGPDFLVMEYVDGRPLAGPLSADQAAAYAQQIASALEAAHARGIVHRDLKPANILVTSAGVKLLDFGLAKMRPASRPSDQPTVADTMAGTVIGTAAYMSPEQAAGLPADTRADIFSFGVLLFEMVTGRRAFGAATLLETLAAVIHREVDLSDLPPQFGPIVARCLRKQPDDRFQTMTDVRYALEQPDAALPILAGSARVSIAVLPFANLSGDEDSDYFSDGLAEEILSALSRVDGLQVAARTSSFAFRGQDIRRIGEALDVTCVLEGSVRRSGNRVRVTVQLINTADAYQVWAGRYDRELTDVFAVQDDIAAAVTDALRLTLAPASSRATRYLPSFDAYEAFLKGKHFMYLQTADGLKQGIDWFRRATEIDPNYPDPHIQIAAAVVLLWYFGVRLAREAVPMIRQEIQQALELATYSPRGHGIAGVVAACCDYDWPKANQHLEQAMSGRGATDAEVRWSYAKFYLMPRGRHAEAIDLMRLCVREDPLNIAFLGAYLDCLNTGGLFSDAIDLIKRIDEIYPSYWIRHLYEAETRIFTGDLSLARASAEEARRQAPWHSRANGILAAVRALQGDAAGARDLTVLLQAKPDWAPAGMVVYSLLLGDLPAAAHWYGEAIRLREMWAIYQSWGHITRDLRASEHWPALASLMRLPADW